MRITQIVGTHLDLTDAIKDYVEKRLAKIEKFTSGLEPCDVAVDVGKTTTGQQKGKIFRAEFNLNVPGKLIRAEDTEEDLYAAIDQAAEILSRQVKEYKDKLKG
ncbi:MAG: sigma 54 modulation protein/ribosomal protein S30EA [uncultured bacterium]|uniref:Sigma 54 modulation protein/ribosomal protein S30EA n=1 Tax=Candidatus Uhrbacteria bacterium GW2011_GWC1_41_20 TaxID=1618983 RepID=A0A0G0XQT7_9BACT|nr:MAG: sigma 54 modulation protein/ribosomal protein S30EA [uncultured bacterium]KKR22668.1 MAG: Sigma 54 modulation protein/ribosomal protein S30EA [Candidatus Uhrbacteria bacterium GW2011_GWE1_39_46]KKR63973.1 MAG: Sigma 54 modulation protein/ribosomal protein S30EA [Candidatus Uhrbacteria bacterium GW2011_GWC2_40_450]KKR88739.1 MAG: Sigma 54 modulation protein/ribosomal protein S30EA [Candidatus Uhrbacteria bacterium GW2011_GWE2_41_1153]KKR90232.1 MAG: Sigma 54 modulation protein/ribosomal 